MNKDILMDMFVNGDGNEYINDSVHDYVTTYVNTSSYRRFI